MTPNPENLMKITGYAHSSDDEQSALSHINLVKAVDGLTETPGCRPALFRTISRARSKSESEVSADDSASINSVEDDDVASTTSQDHGPYAPINDPIQPGDRVVVKNKYAGTCRYVGPIKEKHKSSESFVGVELDQKMTRFGGVFGSKKYFDCPIGHGIMVTFKNVEKLTRVAPDYDVSDASMPEMVELAPFSKTTRTISQKTFKSASRTSSHDSNDTHFDVNSLVNGKGWKVSNGYEKTKVKQKSSSLQHPPRDGRNGSGTMEILENFKSMQDEFRSLPAHVNDEVEQHDNCFDPRKFYKFKPFYFHEDLGPMRCNLGEKNVSIDCPNPEWDQMRQSFEMITKQKTVSIESADSAYDGGDPAMMAKYYTSSSSASSRRSSTATQNNSSNKSRGNKLSPSSRQAPKVLPIRIRRYYEKETDSSGICDSDGSTGNKQKAVVKCQNYPVVPIEKRRRSSKSSSKSSSRSKSLTNRNISPKAAEMSQHIVLNVMNSKKACCSASKSVKSKAPKESILKSFSILNRDCDANRSTCDECGAAKLSDLGRISKGKLMNSNAVDEPSRVRDNVALMSDNDSGGDSLEIDDVVIGFDQLSARTKSNQSSSPESNVVVSTPNICEKWAEKHGQSLTPAMQKGIKKLEAALM